METARPVATNAKPVVAAFDFDGTLTQGDTLMPFLIRSLSWPRFAWAIFLSLPWLAAFFLRLNSNHSAKSRLLACAFKGWTQEQAKRHADDFTRHYLPDQWRGWALQQLQQHQQLGHRCVIVSASPDIYLQAVAASLGVDALLCTQMEFENGRYTGRMATPNCHGEEKVRRLQTWLAKELGGEVPELHAYGDTKGDLPMLKTADVAWYREQRWSRENG